MTNELSEEQVSLKCRLQEVEAEKGAYFTKLGKQKKELSEAKEQVKKFEGMHKLLEDNLNKERAKSISLESKLLEIIGEKQSADNDTDRRVSKEREDPAESSVLSPTSALDKQMSTFTFGDTERQETEYDNTFSEAISSMKQDLANRDETILTLNQKLDEERTQSEELEKALTEIEDKLAETIEDRASQRVKTTQQLESLEATSQQQQETITEQNGKLASLTSALEAQADEHKNEKETMEQQLNGKIGELETEIEQLKEQCSGTESDIKTLKEQKEAVEEERTSKAQQLEEAALTEEGLKNDVGELQEKVAALEEDRKAQVTELEGKLASAQQQLDEAAEASSNLLNEKNTEISQLEDANKKLANASEKAEGAQSECDAAKAETADMKEKLEKSEAERQDTEKKLEELAKKRIEEGTSMKAKLQQWSQAYEELKKKYDAAQQQADTKTEEVEELKTSSVHVDVEELPPLPKLDLQTHKWLSVRSNFRHIRMRPQGVGKQWRVHNVKLFDATGVNIATTANRMRVSAASFGEGADTIKPLGHWEGPEASKDNSWLCYDLPSSEVVWRVEVRSSVEDGLQPLKLVVEGSRDGKTYTPVAYGSGEEVKPHSVYMNGDFVKIPYKKEILHQVAL
eukprot:TRINITY_DN2012_c1_g2_i4.p1 TRINITY_DN2012_c1_g2~~TRINITY_DN2012_c1_g2_i4.p1  ORF type:complete len:651 (+),score=235.23 TRINITY_DN2012_c1_g2_i4:64-1953(+)